MGHDFISRRAREATGLGSLEMSIPSVTCRREIQADPKTPEMMLKIR